MNMYLSKQSRFHPILPCIGTTAATRTQPSHVTGCYHWGFDRGTGFYKYANNSATVIPPSFPTLFLKFLSSFFFFCLSVLSISLRSWSLRLVLSCCSCGSVSKVSWKPRQPKQVKILVRKEINKSILTDKACQLLSHFTEQCV